MASRRAGVISIALVSNSSKLQSEAKAGGASLSQLGATAQVAGRNIGQGMTVGADGVRRLGSQARQSGSEIASYGAIVIHTAEAAAALAASHALAVATMAKYTAGAAASASSTSQLVNGYRALRLILSPTVFTAASIGVGILVEETIRLVNARAKLIDQQALFGASNKVSFGSVDSLDQVSKVSGSNPGNVRSLFTGLQSQFSSNKNGVQSALDKLGVSGSVGDPAVLGKIAAGFHAISDPAKQAQLAVALFGDQAGLALRELNGQFATSADSVSRFGIRIDELSRTQIHQFRQDLLDLKNSLTDFSTAKAWWESFKTGTEIVAAAAEDMSKRGISALDELLARYLPGITTLRLALGTLTPGLAILLGKYGPAAIPTPAPPPAPRGAAGDSTGRGIVADTLLEEAKAAKRRYDDSLEGQREIRDSAASRSSELRNRLVENQKKAEINPNDPTLLKPDEKFSIALQQKNASDLAAATRQHVAAVEEAQKAEEAAAKAAEQALKSVQSYERSAQEKSLTPVERIYAKRDDLGLTPGSNLANRATDAANKEAESLLNEQSAQFGKTGKQSSEIFGFQSQFPDQSGNFPHVQGSAELGLKQRQQADNKELDASLKEWADGVVKSFRINFEQIQKGREEAFKVGNITAQRTAEAGIDSDAEKRLGIEAQYAAQRLHSYQEQVEYLHLISAIDAADLNFKLQAAQAELENAKRLGDAEKIEEKSLAVDKARLAAKKQQLETTVQQASIDAQHNTTLKQGLDSFFRDAKAQTKEPGDILKDGLNSAVDGVSFTLSKALSGQKADWGKMFQQLGQQQIQETAKAGLQKGIGWVGKKFGLDIGQKKDGQSDSTALWVQIAGKNGDTSKTGDDLGSRPTGKTGDPVHVIQDENNSADASPFSSIFHDLSGKASSIGDFFSNLSFGDGGGGGGATESVTSAFSSVGEVAPGFAGGTDSTPVDSAYWVGENGPELEMNSRPHSVVPMSKLGGSGDTHVHNYQMPGADIGAAGRLKQMQSMTEARAVKIAMNAVQERSKRTPRGTR